MCWLHRADYHVSGRKLSRTALEQELLSCGVRQSDDHQVRQSQTVNHVAFKARCGAA